MAQIVDYASLVSFITDWFDRSGDTVFTGRIDSFIGLAEDTWTPTLLNRRMETSVSLTTDATGYVAYPTDFYRPRGINGQVNAAATYFPPIGPNAVSGMWPISTGDNPGYVQMTGTGIQVQPPAVQTFTLDYWAKFVGLSASNATNWIILNNPSLYQWSVGAQAAAFNQDWDTAAKMEGTANSILNNITDYLPLDYYMNAEVVLDQVTP